MTKLGETGNEKFKMAPSKLEIRIYQLVCLVIARLDKAPTRAAVCSITQYYRGPWFNSRDRQLDSGLPLPGSVK